MKKRAFAATFAPLWALGLGLLISAAAPAAAGNFTFVSSQTFTAGSYDEALATARNGNNLYVVGFSSLGADGADIWVSEWNASSMTLLSAQTFNGGANGDDAAQGVALDSAGNAYVVGYSSAPGGEQLWMGKFSPALSLISTVTYNIPIAPPSALGFTPAGIMIGSSGNIYVAETTVIGPNYEILIAQFDASLNFISSTTYFSGNSADTAYSIAQDSGGNFYVGGGVPHTAGASSDIWVGKFNSALGYVNSTTLNGTANQSDSAWALQVDPTNSFLFVAGGINNNVYEDFWLGQYDLNLNLLKQTTVVASPDIGGTGLSLVVTSTRVYVAGQVVPNAFLGEFDYSLNLLSSATVSAGSFSADYGLAIDSAAGYGWSVGYASMSVIETLLDKYQLPPVVSTAGYAGCAVVNRVGATGQPYATISAAVSALPSSLSAGESCVVIEDGATYQEQVRVQNFTMNASSIAIFADPASGLTPTVDPPAASTAAFVIANASVSVTGINIVPTNAVSYGVLISSAYVSLSSVNVQDAGGKIATAGIVASSWTTVSGANITVAGANASGFWLPGSVMTSVSYSVASANNSNVSRGALFLNGAASNTFTALSVNNPAGHAVYLDANSNSNSISQSTMSGGGAASFTLYLAGASSNTITQDYIATSSGTATYLDAGSNNNTISLSTLTGASANAVALYLWSASYNAITQSYLASPSGAGAYLYTGSNGNTISLSTLTVNDPGNYAFEIVNSSSNTVTQSYIANPTGTAAALDIANDSTINQSTMMSGATGYYALSVGGSTSSTISGDSIQGSTAVYISGSIGTLISGSTLVATNSALQMGVGSANLTLSGSVLTAGSAGAAVYLGANNSGLIVLSTNALTGAMYGVFAAMQTAGTHVWVTSNTILPAVTSGNSTYGLYFNGLTSGATIENNTISYRTPGSMGGNTSYALYAQNASGLQIDHNRFDEPGMITGGSFVAADFFATSNTAFKFNDLNATGTSLTNAYMVEATNASIDLVVKDNIASSSFTVSGSSATVYVDTTSETGFAADYNDYSSANAALGFRWGTSAAQGLPAWSATSAQDAHSISANPLWFNPAAGVEDFHPLSVTGRWNPVTASFVVDAVQSPTIDAGDPAEPYGLEPAPNGGIVNQGSSGDTTQASESVSGPTSVALASVGLSSAAVSFAASGANSYVVQASTTAGFSSVLFSSDTTTGATILAPQGLNPNTTYYLRAGSLFGATTTYAGTVLSTSTLAQLVSGTTVYQVDVTSMVVNWLPLQNDVSSNSASGYVLQVSSRSDFSVPWTTTSTPNVALSTLAASGLASGATYYFRVGTLNWDGAVDYAPSVSAFLPVQLASGFPGCAVTESVGSTQPYTTIQSAVNALPNPLTGYSCVVIQDGATYPEQVAVQNFTMNGSSIAIFANPASGLTPAVDPPAASMAAFVIADASVSVQGINITPTNAITYGVLVSSAYVSLSSVNVQDAGGNIATAGVAASSWTTVSYANVAVGGANASGFWLPGSAMTSVSYCTATANGSNGYALYLNGASSNTIARSYFSNNSSTAAYLSPGSDFNNIIQSTMTGGTGATGNPGVSGGYGLDLNGAFLNTVVNSVMSGGGGGGGTGGGNPGNGGYGAFIDAGSSNLFAQDVISGGGSGSGSGISGGSGSGAGGGSGASGGAAAWGGWGGQGLYIQSSSSNTVTFSVMNGGGMGGNGSNRGGNGLYIGGGSSNTVTQCVMSGGGGGGGGTGAGGGAGGTASGGGFGGAAGSGSPAGGGGYGAAIGGGFQGFSAAAANFNTISLSTITGGSGGNGSPSGLSGFGAYFAQSAGNSLIGSDVQGSTAVWVSGSSITVISASALTANGAAGNALQLDQGSANLTLSNSSLSAPAAGAGIDLAAGNGGLLAFSTDTVAGAGYGMIIAAQAAGASLSINSLNFTNLASSATAIDFTGGVFVSTFAAVNFGASVAVNVNAVALSTGSSITMSSPSGAKSGPAFDSDPNDYVHWPSSNPPTSVITTPAAAFINSLPSISGTAQAFSGAGVSGVAVSVQNLATGRYWNGTSFTSSVQFYSAAAVAGFSLSTWTYSAALLSSALTNGTSYQIQSQATDSFAQVQFGASSAVFTYDTTPPTVFISSPVNGSSLTIVPAISGTSADGVGVSTIALNVQQVGGNYYCPALGFSAVCPSTSTFPAQGTPAAWSYSGIPWTGGHQYTITATAKDAAGNIQAASSGFTVLVATASSAPVSVITAPGAPSVNALPNILGTAQAFLGANVVYVDVSIRNLSNGYYWSGSSFNAVSQVFSPAPSIVATSSSSVSWTYPAAALATALTSGTSYQIQSQAEDSNSLFQTATSTFNFVFDNVPPSLLIQVPVQGAVYSSLPAISGTSADAFGVSTISLSVQQIGAGCYNPAVGNFSAACPNAFPAQGIPTAWSYSGIPWVFNGPQYIVSVTALDAFGNAAFVSNNFNTVVSTAAGSPPVSAIASPNTANVNALPSIGGTAQALSGASVVNVGVSILSLANGHYWNGASFSASSQFFIETAFTATFASSVTWAYANPALAAALTSGTSYQIQSQATNSFAQVQTAVSTFDFVFDNVPPSLLIQAPVQGAVYSSLPAISGTSADGVGVSTISLSIAQAGGGCYSPHLGNFTVACPNAFPAQGTPAAWNYPGITWVSGQQYIVSVTATDSFGNTTLISNGFNILVSTGLTVGVPGDGQGSAAIAPSTASCQLVTATATYTAGPAGMAAGGEISLSIPYGWTQPQGSAPNQPGYVQILSASGYTTQFNPTQAGNAASGVNAIVYNAATALSPGQNVQFIYQGYPGQGSSAQGPQIFSFESRGGGNGNLIAISSSPAMLVLPGAPALLSFVPSTALILGATQTSPAMQVQLLDACGTPTVAPSIPLAINLQATVGGTTDAQAVFYSTTGTPVSSVSVPVGGGLSPGFSFNTSTAGVSLENLLATATLGASAVSVARPVNLLPAPASINGVSVDTGTPGSATSATISASGSAAQSAFINFTLSNPALNWEVVISSNPAAFTPKLADFTGTGNPGRTLVWNGLNLLSSQSQFLPPGTYYVEIIAGGGSAVNTSLSITIAPSASIYGVLTNGPGAIVSASGPNVGPGNFAVASSTGFFQIFGLQNGSSYLIQASSNVAVSSSVLTVTASTNGVVATTAGTNVGNLTFQLPSLLEVSASLTAAAPVEMWGSVSVHNASFTQTGSGSIHFALGSTASDNGGQSFGVTASTLTAIAMPPGTYEVDVALPALGISTAVLGVVVNNGSATFLPIALQKQANVYGYAILPSTVAANTWVSVQAQNQAGGVPSVLGGVTVSVSASSAIYSLFGLSPGTWTVTAVSQGALPAVSTVVIAGSADVGNAVGGGLNLTLKSAGVLTGVLTVTGNTSLTNMSAVCPGGAALCVPVTVYSPTSFYTGSVTVVLATSTAQSSSAFSLAGLPDGLYFLSAQLNGFVNAGQNVNVVSGAGASSLTLVATGSELFVTVNLPGGPHLPADFKAVSLGFAGTHGETQSYADMTAGTTVQYFASSATVQFASLNADAYQFQAFYSGSGMYRAASASLGTNTTSSVLLDLSGSTYAVSGAFSLAANLSLPNSAGQSVTVSSVTGLLANTGSLNYCLLGYASPPSIPVAHLELLPAGASGNFAGGPLQTSGCPTGANLISPLNASASGAQLPNPYLAYTAPVAANGSFSFSNVPPGVYELRNNNVIDAGGDQIPQFVQTVIVTGTVSGLIFQIGGGASVSGSVLAPAGTALTRSMTVSLANGQGQILASAQVSFNNTTSASYSFPQIVNGNYTLLLQDSSYPKVYAAQPLSLQVAGQNLSGQNLQAAPSGTIKGHIALQENLNGTQQLMLISAVNLGLLPASLQIQAVSAQGSLGYASGPNGGTTPVLDSNGEFTVDGLLPGTYSVLFTAQGAAGSVALVNTSVPGVVVQGGSVSDIGTASLAVGAQLSGRITAANTGLPLANISVEALPSQRGSGVSSQGAQALTDGSGRYVLNGLDSTVRYYDVYAAFRGNEQQGETLPAYQQTISPAVDVSTVSSLSFALAPAAYSVSGRIAAPAGGPSLGVPLLGGGLSLPGAVVYLQMSGVIPLRNPIADIQFQTDINGFFTIPSLTTGTYALTATSLGYSAVGQLVTVSSASVNVGVLTMAQAGTLTGSVTNQDGSNPSVNSVSQILAASSDLSSVLTGALTTNPNTQTVTGYSISGFKPNLSYHVIIIDSQNGIVSPPEASNVVLTSTGSATINIVYRPTAPLVVANASRQAPGFLVQFALSQPLRKLTPADDDLSLILTTFSASGILSQFTLSQNRTMLSAFYFPGVSESSFTLRLSGYSTLVNPNSTDPVNNQFLITSTVTFFIGIDGLGQSNVANLNGGDVLVAGDNGRVTLPPGSFNVAVASAVLITLQVADEPLTGTGVSAEGVRSAASARLESLRYAEPSYPSEILAAAAAVPPSVNPLSAFYNIFLPLGVSTALSKPAQLTVSYSTGTDPSALNLYWYNPAANVYILTQDVTGAQPVINTANHTITLNVNHFSTYVLFQSAQAVITGSSGAGALQADNFPNPFDLGQKTVTPLHTAACGTACTINGTMIGVSVPTNLSGDATIRIFNVAGTRVRTIDLGSVQGGTFYYQNWDGTNDSGRAVASGAYIGELKIGTQTTFFRMAIIKGSGL